MRELTPETITDAVLEQMATTPDPRMREVMASAVRHLHAFARDVNPFLGGAQVIEGIVVRGQDGPRVRQHPIAQVGERHTAPRLLHDRAADDGLHPADVLADCRLRQVQDGRGTVKSATVGHRHDAAQRCDVQDLSHATKVLRSAIQIKDLGFCTELRSNFTQPITIHDRS